MRYLTTAFLTGLTIAALAGSGTCQETASRERAADLAVLLNGVETIGTSGVPGPLCVFGPDAFAVVAGRSGDVVLPVVAASRTGAGRVVAFGHTGYLSDHAMLASGDMPRMLKNAARWAAGLGEEAAGEAAPRVGIYRNPRLVGVLQQAGVEATHVNDFTAMEYDVLFASPTSIRSEQGLSRVEDYVRDGGGLVTAGLGWGWMQLNPGQDLSTAHPGNRLLAAAGIAWADGTLQTTSERGFAAGEAPSKLTRAPAALDALLAHERGESTLSDVAIRQAARTVELAAQSVPPGDPFFLPRLDDVEKRLGGSAVAMAGSPLRTSAPLARLVASIQTRRARRADAESIKAHPAAADFPGAVSTDAPRVARTLTINTRIPNWHSTGLYAAPGEVVRVRVAEELAAWKRPLELRIGCHSDRLWHKDAWRRMPEITVQRPIDATETAFASPYGGLVYVVVPNRSEAGEVQIEIDGAVESPLFVLDQTPLEAWRDTIRHRPGPWAELATDKVVLSVPSAYVRELDDPESLMRYWDRVLDACAELACRPLERRRPERMVADRQISAGYMHSGYPIMTPASDSVLRDFTELERLKRGNWGFFHELGHNHQSGAWTFSGTVEVTVNLFTLYVYETVCGIPVREARDVLAAEGRRRKLEAYFDGGARFDDWKSDPFLALIMYVELQEAFGWDAFRGVFEEYRELPSSEIPRDDAAKRDQWMIRFSREVGRDLGPFFEKWGVPTSPAARAAIADLPDWMPSELSSR